MSLPSQKEISFRITSALRNEIRRLSTKNILTGVYLEPDDADGLVADLQLLIAEVNIHRRVVP
jgi:hypothetical protein